MADGKTSPIQDSEKIVLVLQGGGALGAYQAGVFEELAKHAIEPSWLAGISIGAINASLIAGNPPERRTERLRAFWDIVSSGTPARPVIADGTFHSAFNRTSALLTSTLGAPGFFKPRLMPPFMHPDDTQGALSYYDTAPLRETLEELIDFDLLNSGKTRLSLGAVNIGNGNYVYFDTLRDRIGPEHVMASGALPPGLPPIEIDGEVYWDGGLVSNTPLQIVLDEKADSNRCVFQVDLFSASGKLPETIFEVYTREKEIRFSSRTRLNTDNYVHSHRARELVAKLLAKLPPDLESSQEAKALRALMPCHCTTVVHLIYRKKPYEVSSYDFEFSRLSVEDHWRAGAEAVGETLRSPRWAERRPVRGTIQVLDLTKPQAAEKAAPEESKGEAAEIRILKEGARS